MSKIFILESLISNCIRIVCPLLRLPLPSFPEHVSADLPRVLHDEESLVPRAVVADVVLQEALDVGELAVEQAGKKWN